MNTLRKYQVDGEAITVTQVGGSYTFESESPVPVDFFIESLLIRMIKEKLPKCEIGYRIAKRLGE